MDGWIDRFEALETLTPKDRAELIASSSVMQAPAGYRVFTMGDAPRNMLLLLSGTVSVRQTSASGREILLYRIEAGQSCILTTACLLADDTYAAEAVTDEPVEAVAISRVGFDSLLVRSEAFRKFVFASYGTRIADLFHVIEDVAFGRIDMRLAARLIALADAQHTIRTTHQELAVELGTAREVISRQLQEFQRRGWLTLSRGVLRLEDPSALRRLAES